MLLALTTVVTMAGQDKKSDRVVSIDGTKYYLHTVQPKETLYSLSRTYGLAIEDIQANNEGMEMLKAGEVVKLTAAWVCIQQLMPWVSTLYR